MAKITARMNGRGTDLEAMKQNAISKFEDLSPGADWTITEIDLWGEEDVGTRQGMVSMWTATITATADVE